MKRTVFQRAGRVSRAVTAMDFKGAPFVGARHEKGVRILAPRHRGMWDIFGRLTSGPALPSPHSPCHIGNHRGRRV